MIGNDGMSFSSSSSSPSCPYCPNVQLSYSSVGVQKINRPDNDECKREENDGGGERERERKESEQTREREIMGWVGERTHYYRLTYWKNRELYVHIHCAVANFLLHFNV